jgi:hypothetical protein
MIPKRPLALAALLLAASAALAQPGASEDATPAPPPPKAASGEENKAPAPAGADKPSAQTGRSPSDYRASEQISEDLPVSFPVDI